MSFVAMSLVIWMGLASNASSLPPDKAEGKDAPPGASSSQAITYGGGDGSNCDKAITIIGAQGERDGVHAEYVWLQAHYPGYRMQRQAERSTGGKEFDVLEFNDRDASAHSVCFDITAFYGRF